MADIYVDGGFLAFWYDTWIVLIGFIGAVILAIMVISARKWSGLNLVLTILVVLGVLGALTLTLIRIGLDIRVDSYNAVGGISVAGTALALIAGAAFLLMRRYQERPTIAAAVEPSVTPMPEPAVEPEADTADEPGSATATLIAEPDITPLPDQPVSVPSPTAWVHFNTGSMAGQTIPLDPSGTSLGRGADNDIVLDDATVSRRHASISFHDGNFFMEDNESASGTLVEGMQATRTMLESGSILRLGETEMVFMESETAPSGEGSGAPAGAGAPGETLVVQPTQVVMTWLAVTTGPRKGQTYQLKVGDNTLGRGAENDMVIEDSAVSRSHAMIRVRDDEMLLVDLGSRGGTKVAGQTLEGKSIRSGSVVIVGQTTLNLVEVEAGQQAAGPVSSAGETMIAQPGASAGGVMIVQSGPDAGKSFPLVQGDNVVGRDPEGQVVLSDDAVSRRHALIRQDKDDIIVFDLGSRTGTRVDGEPLGGHVLSGGDTITLGTTELVLMQPGSGEGSASDGS